MRKYPLYYLSDSGFENLTTLICRRILGEGVIPFAAGKDGGRDGRFHGKANCFPSESAPWEGKIVIQAKHTGKENPSCSDSDFQRILRDDVLPTIERLKKHNLVDFYMLFTNRRLTGIQDEKIESLISENVGLPNIVIADEKIQQWLQSYPDIVKEANLQSLLTPLQFDEEDLKALVIEFYKSFTDSDKIYESVSGLNYLNLEIKNELNQLSKDYFDSVMKKNFIHFEKISNFLKDPINQSLKEFYEDTVDELNAKIIIKRNEYNAFDNILEDLYNYVISNSSELGGKKRLVRLFLHYMYCNCDIGRKDA
ncbi:ABC-three component system protein [Capnocytophaga canis]|uniref:ABC-three component system protein n=1 Tax=Capnocytophaga canis TaxID=1848903 RepID=UPI001561BA14|nr:ABC-three component system protein [Capnocytophaga canis]